MDEHASKSPLSPAETEEDDDEEMEESESQEHDPYLHHDRNPDDVSGFFSDDSSDTLMLPGGGPGDPDAVRVATNLPAEMPTDPLPDNSSSDSDNEDGQGPTFFWNSYI